VSVDPFKCKKIDFISAVSDEFETILVDKKDGAPPQVTKSEADVKAWFKIDQSDSSKKDECLDLQFKLEKKAPGAISSFEDVSNDPLVSITQQGQLVIQTAQASLTAQDYYVTAFTALTDGK